MRRFLCTSLVAVALIACDGGEGTSCLFDSDCADFSQVCIEGTCRLPGEVPDGGPRRDGSTSPDSGPGDDAGPEMDGGPGDDAGPPEEGGMPDAGDAGDAGMMACDDVVGDWVITFVNASASCGDAMTGFTVRIGAGAVACEYMVTSTGSPALDGTFTLGSDNTLLGDLTTGTAASVSCNGNYSPASQQFTIICGSCVINLNRAT